MKVDPTVIAEKGIYHWRDSINRPLCYKDIAHAKLVKYSEAKQGRVACEWCRKAADEMAKGFAK